MDALRDLYQELILDHSKKPRNYRVLEHPDRTAEGYNPLCGDHFHVYVELEGDKIKDVSFQGSGCALSKASASMMTATLKGKTRAEAEQVFERFHQMVTGQDGANAEALGKLAVFSGVSEFPVRVKCVSLAWHTLKAALEGEQQVSTE
jgi:nitrogen fixation protein NifU and related proteins